MKRLAVFVEGQTEQMFVERLLLEMAAKNTVYFELRRALGGGNIPRRCRELSTSGDFSSATHYALIVDCTNDDRVNSEIKDQYDNLISKGYQAIVGLRDLYPKTLAEFAKVKQYNGYGIKTKPVKPALIIAVMEVEAWFFAEYTHFQRVNAKLNANAIATLLGFDPEKDDVTLRTCPADDLNRVYQSVGKSYHKRKAEVSELVDKLDYARLYADLSPKVIQLGELVKAFDAFLAS